MIHLNLSAILSVAFVPLISVPIPANKVDLLFFIKTDNASIACEIPVFFPLILENYSLIFLFNEFTRIGHLKFNGLRLLFLTSNLISSHNKEQNGQVKLMFFIYKKNF